MIDGQNRIGFQKSSKGTQSFQAFSPVKETLLPETFTAATEEELNEAVAKAVAAQKVYARFDKSKRAEFLRQIADEIEALGDALIERAVLESGLPAGRITGERGRTANQLRLFATVVEEGKWVEASIDVADPDRQPLPKPDIRKMLMPLGVVGVFGASNFPLAFSTAGGDTASALASGNAVVLKAHPYHPGTNEMISGAIISAAEKTGMPDGIFSSLNALDFSIGKALVLHKDIKACAFTGSYHGGKALYDLVQTREDIIPFFAEMGSINPVFIMPDKLRKQGAELGATMAGSITVGCGQFCTNPGFMVVIDDPSNEAFYTALGEKIKEIAPQPMLHPNIKKAYQGALEYVKAHGALGILGATEAEATGTTSGALVAKVAAGDFLADEKLAEEVFGPFSLLVVCKDSSEAEAVLAQLQGQLTCTVMSTDDDVAAHGALIDALRDIAGRLIFNGVPTGVEVNYSMHHGGPFPATTDARFTSVGVDAIKRFARPVAFQDAPESYLPVELRNGNEFGIWRRVDGKMSNGAI